MTTEITEKEKKKKKKKKEYTAEEISILNEYDNYMNDTYDDIISEIQDMQMIIAVEDKKIMKRAKKAAKKGNKYYNVTKAKKEVRQHILGKMESSNWFTRILNILKEIAPIITIIARLVAALILSILSIDEVKVNISKQTLETMNNIYSKAMSLN